MFEKEYITQKILLFIAMIFILGFAYNHYLSEKNGISFQEGENFTIANSSENSDDNPYHTNVYNTEEIQDYINSSLIQCSDEAEKKAVVEVIRMLISGQ